MTYNHVFCKRFVVVWNHSTSLRQVARPLGSDITPAVARRIARRLRRDGVRLAPRPNGHGLLGFTYLFKRLDGDYEDLRGREAYAVGHGTLIEGPWACRRCEDRLKARGFLILRGRGRKPRFVCRECARVVD